MVVLAALVTATTAGAGPAPKMEDEKVYDVLTYSAWGRKNDLSGASCTGLGPAGKAFLGPTHGSFRCEVQVGEAPAGTVTVKVLGPESVRVTSISKGSFGRDGGIGAIPGGTPATKSFEAVIGLQRSAWAKARKVARVLCYGVGASRESSTSASFYAFQCATFSDVPAVGTRGPQVLVTAVGEKVNVVRVLAP